MNRSTQDASRRLCSALVWIPLAAALGLFACFTAQRPGGPQNWWEQHGPVVPHDSFPEDCSLCHTGDDWHGIRSDFEYDHLAETGTALLGAHAQAECLRCHNDRGPVALFAARGCAGCHEDVHEAELGRDCTLCHSEENWRPEGAVADHSRTRFPLLAAHSTVACWRCHTGARVGDFSGLPVECVFCHTSDLARATDPDHLSLGWTSDCEECHRATTWRGKGFLHSGFPLTGAHADIDCGDCHEGAGFVGLPTDCWSCHADDYAAATSLDHVGNGISMECDDCHSTSRWDGARFSHTGIVDGCVNCHQDDYDGANDPDHIANGFSTDCQDCHGTNHWSGANFSHEGITNGCVECHLADFQGADDPDHVAGNFSTDCEDCHGTDTWDGASFSHAGITSGCVDCHLSDYQGANDPDHSGQGFPLTCEDCHGTNRWDDANFSHDFPIDSGRHRTLDCNECHLSPGNFMSFTCTDCHAHRESEMNGAHDDVDDYIWQTSACYGCHPDGIAHDD